MRMMNAVARGCFAGLLTLTGPGVALAQESKSELLAKELVAALSAARLDSIAASDPANAGYYVGAMYIPGLQLIAVGAKYSAPAALDYKLINKAYRDIYLDLSAGGLEDKIFVEDNGGDGLKVRRRTTKDPFDTVELGGKRIAFDYDWKKQKMSLDEYVKAYVAADQRYADMLKALLAQLKKPS